MNKIELHISTWIIHTMLSEKNKLEKTVYHLKFLNGQKLFYILLRNRYTCGKSIKMHENDNHYF